MFNPNHVNEAAFSFKELWQNFKDNRAEKSANKKETNSTNSGSGAGAGILVGLFGLAASVLPQTGIGSKARINEINAKGAYDLQIAEAQNKEKKTNTALLIGGGVLVLLIVVVIVVSMKK